MIGTPHQAIHYALLLKKEKELRAFLEGWLKDELAPQFDYFKEFVESTAPGPSARSAVELAGVRTVLIALLGLEDGSASTEDMMVLLTERYTAASLEGSKLSARWLAEAGYKKAARAVNQEIQLARLRYELQQAQKGDGK